jgi:hypothetical protein
MDTAVVVLVLILVVGLFGFISWLFIREVGWQRARLLVVAPFVGMTSSRTGGARQTQTTSSLIEFDRAEEPRQIPAVSDEALRTLREEIQGELVRATGVSREFDARLTRIESIYGDSRRTPDDLEAAIRDVEAQHGQIAEKLHRELGMLQRSASSFGERRVTAVSELYSHLARVEAALAGVVNPALLPGEPLSLPTELGADAFVWDNWRDVGDRAFAFGDVFNQHRYVLDDETAASVESFITTLRQALTGAVYPNVQAQNPTQVQRSQVRSGLTLIVAAVPDIRRKLEIAYRADVVD